MPAGAAPGQWCAAITRSSVTRSGPGAAARIRTRTTSPPPGRSSSVTSPSLSSTNCGYALGAQAGEAAVREIATEAGFTRFRRAAESPFNVVYEIRP